MAVMVNRSFSSVSALREYLNTKRYECGSPEIYDAWLQSFFDSGNTFSVNGEEYDYWACWELL